MMRLQSSACPALSGLLVALVSSGAVGAPAATKPRVTDTGGRGAAVKAARWLRGAAIKTGGGKMWPADPRVPASVSANLYAGTSGVMLFFLEAFRATGVAAFLEEARSGADALLAAYPAEKEWGLYEGVSGICLALLRVSQATGEGKYREGAATCVAHIRAGARRVGKGIEWNGSTDIVSGSAGIGLFLLEAARALGDPASRETAIAAARRLMELAIKEKQGLKWFMTPEHGKMMPNFSHGTAGVAYFLATLYQETGRKDFLDAALGGARYLTSIADKRAKGCLIFHSEPARSTRLSTAPFPSYRDVHYLSWCHGPPGTARLFYRLWLVTKNPTWLDWVKRLARGVMETGIPDRPTAGFWNNVGQCCGSAGVAEFFFALFRVTKDPAYLAFARRMTVDILARATEDDGGVRWVDAEHRIKPDLLAAQTGYMQGAAGIAAWLLRLDAFERGEGGGGDGGVGMALPDNPF